MARPPWQKTQSLVTSAGWIGAHDAYPYTLTLRNNIIHIDFGGRKKKCFSFLMAKKRKTPLVECSFYLISVYTCFWLFPYNKLT